MNDYLLVAAGVLAGPVIGGLVSGADRIITARVQARVGPPQHLELVLSRKPPPHRFRHDFYPHGVHRPHSHTMG